MPMYCYVHPETRTVMDRCFSMGKAPETIMLDDGTVCERCLMAELASQAGQRPGTWPMRSQALAVHPRQAKQYAEFAERHGVPTHFDERGRPEFRTKYHRKQYAELVGATDMDGGYGDPFCG